MIERINGQTIVTEIVRSNFSGLKNLATKYATDFWAGVWEELLIDETGKQYGTYDQNGIIYPNTASLLMENKIKPINTWPEELWKKAGESQIFSKGKIVKQFWTLDSATKELNSFIENPDTEGYGGEIMLLEANDKIIGFTAYSVGTDPKISRSLAQKRYPYQELINAKSKKIESISLESFLENKYPNNKLGLFLDFAISETRRGEGFGSYLFDKRIDRLLDQGAEVIIGRTIKTSPAQYYGNYIARGMEPIAYDSKNPDKAIFAVTRENIKQRKIK